MIRIIFDYFYFCFTGSRNMAGLDRQGYENLFHEHYRELCLFAIRYVKDFEIAREMVQDSFLVLWEKREIVDDGRSVSSYLSTTVRNRCLNYLRDNKKFNAGLLQIEDLSEFSYAQPLKLEVAELSARIRSAVGELPEKCREVFELSRNEHLKYQEIAEKLNISVKTVEAQMSKALQHMRDRLKDYIPVLIFLFLMK